MNDLTIVYYSSNREEPEFEAKIVENLKEVAGSIPIISVTQKPMDLGKNVCIGDVGASDWNIAKQVYLGVLEAKTRYIATAEADCLYPSGHFNFRPKDKMAYRLDNVWIWYEGTSEFRKKAFSLCSMFSEYDYLRNQIESRFGTELTYRSYEKGKRKEIFRKQYGWEMAHGDLPVINIKTPNGMRKHCGTDESAKKLPYWGTTEDVSNIFKGAI